MAKSVIGKRVRIINSPDGYDFPVGSQGTITEVLSDNRPWPVRVHIDKDTYKFEGKLGSLFSLDEVRYLNNKPVKL